MSILDKPKHEKLAQELALGVNQTDAYERAGYARDDGHASRLAGDGRIQARVRELLAEAARHVALSRADMIAMLIADHAQARANRQMSAAIRAAELLGRELHGMFMERREVTTRDDIRQLSDTELYESAAQAAEALGEIEIAEKLRHRARTGYLSRRATSCAMPQSRSGGAPI